MPNASPHVSVIVPTHNRAETLPETLDAILAQAYGDFELIVVDDASKDATPEVLQRYDGRIKAIRVDYCSPAKTRNAGARAALGEYLLFADDDCVVPPDWIERMIEAYSQAGCAALSGGIDPYELDSRIQRYQHYRMRLLFRDRTKRVHAAPVVNFLISSDWFWRVGGFDEFFEFSLEDWAFCRQLHAIGGTICYEPGVQVKHRYRGEAGPVVSRLMETAREAIPAAAKLGQSPEAMMVRSLLKWLACPLWSAWFYPWDLYSLSCRIESRFFLARLGAYLRHRLGPGRRGE